MVIVTDRAKERLAELKTIVPAVDHPSIGLRLEPQPVMGEFALFPDQEKPGDHIVEHFGAKVLLIDEDLSQLLTDATIDCESVGQDARLVIKRPEG